mgnify:CR=1 FL=1
MKSAKKILENLTLKEKIGQLTQYMFSIKDIENLKEKAKQGKIGSIVLSSTAFAGNDAQEKLAHEFLNDIQKAAVEGNGIPILFGRDVIHGHKVVMPVPLAMAASFNPDLVQKCYETAAEEASADGVKWAFAPMLDISRDSRWGRCIESPGEDPYVGECMAKAAVKGFQKNKKMLACAKHFIGYGASEGGRDYHRTEISEYSLRNYYLKAFKSAVDAGVATVMTSFNDINGQPTTSDKYLLRNVLKEELGFDGFVVSDWGAIGQLQKQGVAETRKDCAELAMLAGVDMDMCDFCYEENLELLIDSGRISEDIIDEAVLRILEKKIEFGLFDNPYTAPQKYDIDEHLMTAYKIAAESMVLLKNNGVLPLKTDAKIALIGPMCRETRPHLGSWTLDGDVSLVKSIYDVISRDAIVNAADTNLYDDMLLAVRKSDVVIACLGESHKVNGEMHSLSSIEVPHEQAELIRAAHRLGKPIIGVLCFGRPVALEKISPYLDAEIYAWHSGTKAPEAIWDIITGRVNPSGKLPMTLPRRTGQIPLYYNVTSSGRAVNGYYNEETFQNYDDCLGSPLYPFGYGLSYSVFSYSNIKCDNTEYSLADIENGKKFVVSVNVANISDVKGKETVQLYIRDNCASAMRPIKELKGFKKIELDAGQSTDVVFEIGFDELGYYGFDGKYIVESGEFTVYAGNDCITNNCIKINVK